MNSIVQYRDFLEKTKAKKSILQEQVQEKEVFLSSLLEEHDNLLKVQEIFNITGALAQSEVKGLIEKLISDTVSLVFGSEYGFELESKVVRNQPEIEMYIVKNGCKYNLRDDTEGGGVMDVVSFVLRIVLWAIQKNRTDNIMIFDEPLRHLDGRRAKVMGQMMKKLSEMLGLQMLIVSHSEHLIDSADKVFEVAKNNEGVSVVKESIC